MSAATFTQAALDFFEARAIDPRVAAAAGVREERGALVFPGERRRPLNGKIKMKGPSGQGLSGWWPRGKPEDPGIVLVAEGETDTLAVVSHLDDLPVADLRDLAVLCIPGCGFPPTRLVDELRDGDEVLLALDGDKAGRDYIDRAVPVLQEAGLRPIVVELPEGRDLADCLAAQAEPAVWLAHALLDAEAAAEAAPPADPPEGALSVLSARELCELPDPPGGEELLGPLLRRGQRLVLGAETGAGKTTLALAMVRAVVERREFICDEWQGAGGRALVIDAEQGIRTIKRRLREASLEASGQVDYLHVPDGLALDQDAEAVALEPLLAGYAVVVADPLYKLHRGDSNDERAAVDLMRRFDRWREQFGFALVLPVHCRKPPQGARFTMHELYGQSAYLRGADVVLGLQRLGDGYARLHFFKDRDGDLPAVGERWGLLFDREEGYRRDPSDGAPPTIERVRELLAEQPGLTLAELMAATGSGERTVRDALKKLGATYETGDRNTRRWYLPEQEAA